MSEILMVADVAGRCKIHQRTVKRAIDRGELKASQLAVRGGWRILEQNMWAWLELRANTPRPPRGQPVPYQPIDPEHIVPLRRVRSRPTTGRVSLPPANSRSAA